MTTIETGTVWQSSDRAADWLAGLRVLQQRDGSAAALELWNSAARKFPNAPGIQIGRAACHERLGRLTEAHEIFGQIVVQWPENPAAHAGYLRTLCLCEGDAAGLDVWRSTARRFPQTLQIQMGYASCCERLGHDDEAVKAFARVAAEWPNHVRGRLGEARCVQRRDGPMVAHELWRSAAQQFPQDLPIQLDAASNLEQLGRWREAMDAYSSLAETWPKDQRTHRGRVRCSHHIDPPEEILAKHQHWTTEFPADLDPMLRLARCQEQQGLIDEAEVSYQRCLEISPDAIQARCGLARVREVRHGPEGLVDERLAIAAAAPDDVHAVAECLQLLIRARRWTELTRLVEMTSVRFADEPLAQLAAVDAMMALGLMDRAETVCTALWKRGFRSRGCLTRMVALLRGSGRTEEARLLRTEWFSSSASRIDAHLLSEALENPTLMNGSTMPPGNRTWRAWRSIKGSNRSWQDWYEEAAQNAQRTDLLRRCVDYNSEQLKELDAITILSDPHDLNAAMTGGRGCLLAGSHQGPIIAAARFFDRGTNPFYTLATGGALDRLGTSRSNTIAMDRGPSVALRQVLRVLSDGAIVAITPDGAQVRDALGLPFLNGWLRVSTLIPRLVLRTGAPSLYCRADWVDDEVVITLTSLPEPERGEDQGRFAMRWCKAYRDKLQDQVRATPDVLRSNVVFADTEELL